MVYSIHPSYSANYETGDCLKLRHDLLSAIRQACRSLESRGHGSQQQLSLPKLDTLLPVIHAHEIPEKTRDIEVIYLFLEAVIRMYFQDASTLPVRSIRANQNAPRSYFAFRDHQINDLRHTLICEDTTLTAKSNS